MLLLDDAMQSVLLPWQIIRHVSVCPSVTLRSCGHLGGNSSKLISWLISGGFLLSADSNIMNLLQMEHPKILAIIGVKHGIVLI